MEAGREVTRLKQVTAYSSDPPRAQSVTPQALIRVGKKEGEAARQETGCMESGYGAGNIELFLLSIQLFHKSNTVLKCLFFLGS